MTRMSITSARQFKQGVPDLAGIGKGNWDKLVTHFQIDKFPGPNGWRDALNWIDQIYLNMQTALGYLPQGLMLLADEPSSSNEGAYAFTFAGGYDLSRRNKKWEGMPMGTIYLCARMQNLDGDSFAYVLLHEAAHFVGPTDNNPNQIIDYAYAHRNNDNYKRLLPWQRTHNADNYSQYAFAAIGRPFNLNAHRLVKN